MKFDRRRGLRMGIALAAATAFPPLQACEFFALSLRVTHPWARATAPGATRSPVCMKIDQVTQADRLIGVETPLAEGAIFVADDGSELKSLPISAGRDISWGEEGEGIRLVGLRQPLEIGCSYPLDLVFAEGGRVGATLNIDYTPFRFR